LGDQLTQLTSKWRFREPPQPARQGPCARCFRWDGDRARSACPKRDADLRTVPVPVKQVAAVVGPQRAAQSSPTATCLNHWDRNRAQEASAGTGAVLNRQVPCDVPIGTVPVPVSQVWWGPRGRAARLFVIEPQRGLALLRIVSQPLVARPEGATVIKRPRYDSFLTS